MGGCRACRGRTWHGSMLGVARDTRVASPRAKYRARPGRPWLRTPRGVTRDTRHGTVHGVARLTPAASSRAGFREGRVYPRRRTLRGMIRATSARLRRRVQSTVSGVEWGAPCLASSGQPRRGTACRVARANRSAPPWAGIRARRGCSLRGTARSVARDTWAVHQLSGCRERRNRPGTVRGVSCVTARRSRSPDDVPGQCSAWLATPGWRPMGPGPNAGRTSAVPGEERRAALLATPRHGTAANIVSLWRSAARFAS